MSAAGDTIFALSSGPPPAGIAVVRVSGPAAFMAAEALAGSLPRARTAALRRFVDGGDAIDRGLLLRFPAGGSATGEAMAEFHVHGGRATVARLLAALAAMPGLRPAMPGEFSRRAVLNGRMALVEAEGLADLLAAETEAERRAAFAAFDGALGAAIEAWRVALLGVSALVEALIDHEEEGDVAARASEVEARAMIARLSHRIGAVTDGPSSEELRDGLAVVIAGPPNSGKSSLLNALARRDVALVTPVAGTTRDLIEVTLAIGARRVRLVDTAGLRETLDPVEAMGVERARAAAGAADLRIWLGDGPPPPSQVPTLAVHARCDLPERGAAGARLAISAVTGAGLPDILGWIDETAPAVPDTLLLNRRQRAVTRSVLDALDEARMTDDLLIVAEHLRRAALALDGLTGRAGVEDMLDSLFAGFCIGK